MADTYPQQFGGRVRAIREAKGLSQDALAAAAGLHRTHISLIERGQRSVRLETVVALATAMSVQPAELMPTIALGRAAAAPSPRGRRKAAPAKGV